MERGGCVKTKTSDDMVSGIWLERIHHYEALLDVMLNSTNEWYVIVDDKGMITAMSKAYKAFIGIDSPEGRYVADVIENTRMHQVLESGNAEYGDLQTIRGNKMIATRIPIKREGRVIGAIGKAIFKDIDDLYSLYNKIQKSQRKISIYVESPTEPSSARYTFDHISDVSDQSKAAIFMAKKAARTDSNVLIVGPSGTGKELFSHAIHHESKRRTGPFVMINCAAIPKELLESELFGYEQGAFTGASRQGRKGRFELAHKGTILLDEIGDMPIEMQSKLLRVLQDHAIDRVGGSEPIPVDVRVIAATNRPIETLVQQGLFRSDLYYRLNVMRINLVGLSDRKEEIPVLANSILDKLSHRMDIVVHGISDEAMQVLTGYHWPGNVRELENVLERALNLLEDDLYIQPHLLPEELRLDCGTISLGAGDHSRVVNPFAKIALDCEAGGKTLEDMTRACIVAALEKANGNRKLAAQRLGISRAGLYKKMHHYGLIKGERADV